MRFKYNPWVSMVAALLLAVILLLTCAACSTEAATPPRFQVKYAGHGEGLEIYTITDTETGVQYMFVDDVNCGGLTKLEG